MKCHLYAIVTYLWAPDRQITTSRTDQN